MDPTGSTDFSLYKLRAEIQHAFGIDAVEVQHDLAMGYQQARLMMKMRNNGYPEAAEAKAWETLAELAKKGPNERLRCDPDVTVCNVTKTIEVDSELVVSNIVEIQREGDSKPIVALIDRGREDGIVVGSGGHVRSQYSKSSDGHERESAQLGSAEVLSVDAHSALVQVRADDPQGDGLVREQDLVEWKARTPPLSDHSSLWSAAKFNITFVDSNDRVFFDYGSLYSNETSESDPEVFARMVEDIRRTAPTFADQHKPIQTGSLAGQSVQQAMQNCNRKRQESCRLPGQIPEGFAGKRFRLSTLYAKWVQNGAPSE